MKKIIKLDKNDVQVIMAEKFDCSPEDVQISIIDCVEGYGPTEHIAHKLEVIIVQEGTPC